MRKTDCMKKLYPDIATKLLVIERCSSTRFAGSAGPIYALPGCVASFLLVIERWRFHADGRAITAA